MRGLIHSRPARLAAAFAAFSLVPLALLAIVAVGTGSHAVRAKVKDSLGLSSRLSALYVQSELTGLGEVDQSFAHRPTLVEIVERGTRTPADRAYLRRMLRQLRAVRPGIGTAFLTDTNGKLLDVVPATPSIIGKDFSFRDWYKGVTRTGRAYVSEVYQSAASGHPEVVAVAAPVTTFGPHPRRVGILVAAYDIARLQSFARKAGEAEGVEVEVTDQRGVPVSAGPATLVSRRDDPLVAAALAGRSGIRERDDHGERQVAAYEPVPKLGWTVIAQLPAAKAYASVSALRARVLVIALLLSIVLLGGAWVLARVLRRQRQAEEEMSAALEQARSLATVNRSVLEAMDEGLALLSTDGRVLSVNRALREIAEEVVPGTLRTGGSIVEVQRALSDKIAEREAYDAVMAAAAADPQYSAADTWTIAGTGRAFVLAMAPVRDSRGELLGRIITLRDVTAEHEAERLKSELVATVSHELRTPLASILGFAELLSEREYDAETQQRFLHTIRGEAQRLTTLVNDFLDLQRIEAGRFTLALEPFALDELVREQVHVFTAQSDKHTLEVEVAGSMGQAIGERDRIAQVLSNLLSNAIKYSPAGGTIRVRVEQDGAVARVSITDCGLGIPADQQHKVFAKFFRVDSSDTREIGGTGLGLALTRELVDAHGGRMGFTSEEGRGSTFWFELPVAVPTAPRVGSRILVVEDDPNAAEILRRYLEESDFEVEAVPSAEEALVAIEREAPALVCLDLKLAGEIDGWELLERLKRDSATAGIPVVVCSGSNGRQKASALGVADFLSKPIDRARLRAAIERILPDHGGSVLVVDDDAAIRALVAESLGSNGFELREAADGVEAMAKVLARTPDVIVLDLAMPKLDGFGVLELLQADPATRGVPVIVLTARRLSPEEADQLRSRTVSLLDKNAYSRDELCALVRRALG